jgi:16S rRNA (cytidine1402-2'-O)-methyltransferase
MSTLYLVSTPIGNLEDMAPRGLRVLREAAVIAAEDTRMARRLLSHFGVRAARLTSYNDHNARAKLPQLLAALSEGDVALVSDAGMPAISDPGHELVVRAVAEGHTVVPIPGASAVLAAVAASGLPSRRFHYLGFLPRTSGARRRAMIEAARSGDTLVVFESPHRLRATLDDALAALGDRRIAVCRELTKLHEEIWRGSIADAISHFQQPRGEFTLVIEGRPAPNAGDSTIDLTRVDVVLRELRVAGASGKDAVAELSRRTGLSRRAAYRAWHGEHEEPSG